MTSPVAERRASRPVISYKRVMLKLSGQALQGDAEFGIDPGTVEYVARQVAGIQALGVEVGVVSGGGNIWRGAPADAHGIDRAQRRRSLARSSLIPAAQSYRRSPAEFFRGAFL